MQYTVCLTAVKLTIFRGKIVIVVFLAYVRSKYILWVHVKRVPTTYVFEGK